MKIGKRVYLLRPPSELPLYSERAGKLRVLPLGFGWRLTVRKIS